MMTRTDQARLNLARNLLKYGAVLQRVGDRVLRPLGVSQQEFAVLSAIAREKGPLFQNSIVADLLVERSNLSKIVKRLEAKGLIDVVPTASDRRVRMLKISRAGKTMFKRGELALLQWNRSWLRGLGARDMARLLRLLDRLNATDGANSLD